MSQGMRSRAFSAAGILKLRTWNFEAVVAVVAFVLLLHVVGFQSGLAPGKRVRLSSLIFPGRDFIVNQLLK